jgi:hypothetical protein
MSDGGMFARQLEWIVFLERIAADQMGGRWMEVAVSWLFPSRKRTTVALAQLALIRLEQNNLEKQSKERYPPWRFDESISRPRN